MRAWWTFWATALLGAVLWIAVPLVAGRTRFRAILDDPIGLAILLLPLVAGGVNLILNRQTHETVCRIEAQRHRSFRAIARDGYSARAFGITGVALLAVAVAVLAVRWLGAP